MKGTLYVWFLIVHFQGPEKVTEKRVLLDRIYDISEEDAQKKIDALRDLRAKEFGEDHAPNLFGIWVREIPM